MKKMVFGLILSALFSVAVLADGLYRDSVSYTIRDSLSITNLGTAPFQISALEYTFNVASTGTLSVSRIRSSVTNLLISQAFTNATSAFTGKSSLEGVWLIKNDAVLLETGLAATSTNTVIVTTEDAR